MIPEKFRTRKTQANKRSLYSKYDDVFLPRGGYNRNNDIRVDNRNFPRMDSFDKKYQDETFEEEMYTADSNDQESEQEYFSTNFGKNNIMDERMIKYQKRQLPPLQRYGSNNPKDMYEEFQASSYWDNDRYDRRNQKKYSDGDFFRFVWKKFLITFGLISLLVCVSWIAYTCGSSRGTPPANGRIVIEPETSTFKVLPDNPGGIEIPHQDKTIYNRISTSQLPTEQDDHLLPAQETPDLDDYDIKVDEYSIIDDKTYYVKMAASTDKDALEKELSDIKSKHSDKISGLSCTIKAVRDKSGEKRHAILIGPIESKSQAIELAKSFKTDCSVISVKE